MNAASAVLLIAMLMGQEGAPATQAFRSAKYGVKVELPGDWPIAVREREDAVFVALIQRDDPDRPGVVACEIGLAPADLKEYQTRIDTNAQRGRGPGELVRNEIVQGEGPPRLDSVWEFRLPDGQVWRERKVRLLANRQMYTFTLNVDVGRLAQAESRFEKVVESSAFAPPDTGADRMDPDAENRWKQREYLFSLSLPEGWMPVLAPSEVALFFANSAPEGIWSDNVLVLAKEREAGVPVANDEWDRMAQEFPRRLKDEDPNCEVLSCEVVTLGPGLGRGLETVVRARRGPFSMTVLERRFSGRRFDYEVKFTLETKRFDASAGALRRSLDSFREEPGELPANERGTD
jgi:hypothetical protein